MQGGQPRHVSRDSLDFGQDKEKELSLSDRLKVFKSSQFDPDSYLNSKCQNMSEKEIRHLCMYLKDLKSSSAEEMRKSVYANYSAFIRTAKEISALEGQLLSMRNLLSAQAAVIHGLADGNRGDYLSSDREDSTEEDISSNKSKELTKIENWLGEFLETLEVLLAEKRVEEALAALDEAENVAEEANDKRKLTPTTLLSLQSAIAEQRQKLADQLTEAACRPSTRGSELQSVVLALKRLGDGPRAHSLLLKAHHQKLQLNMQNLQPISTTNAGTSTASLSQLVFSTIAQAANDSLLIFGEETSYTSELVTWSVQETERFALLVKRCSVAMAAASGNLRAASESVHACLGHCLLLESRGLALSPVLLKHFKPCIEQALTANLRRIERTSAALAADEDWSLSYPPGGPRLVNSVSASQPRLTSSGHRFNSMVQELFKDVDTLETMQLVSPTLDGVLQVFSSYVNIMFKALPGSMNEANQEGTESTIVKQAETEDQQVALLANALILADELLPRATLRLLPSNSATGRTDEPARRGSADRQNRIPEQREWKKRLQRLVEGLRDSFCRQHALELIFTDDGDVRLNSHMYTSLDGCTEEPEWFPSQVFQELFIKLTHIASIAADMFVGRERFATILLMRLTETVILFLSNDQTFWEEIEQGPKPLGPLGLQQFYLDMEFVILFSSQGRYLSRNLQQVAKDVIARAIEAVATTGVDPYSLLPEEEWFAEVAQIAIKMLMGKANFGDLDREALSPTASVSSATVS
ncbi:Exocyst complex component exo84a [Ancistrocladus abbreviatus]